jgi:hypothetical protein
MGQTVSSCCKFGNACFSTLVFTFIAMLPSGGAEHTWFSMAKMCTLTVKPVKTEI